MKYICGKVGWNGCRNFEELILIGSKKENHVKTPKNAKSRKPLHSFFFLQNHTKTKMEIIVNCVITCDIDPFGIQHLKMTVSCFIYNLDSSNSSSITFWTNKFCSSSRSNWTSIWAGNSNGSWADNNHLVSVQQKRWV